ncbi:hypothetical protein HU001_04250 [Staphylococcus sp. SS21]|nr:hypothetical protein [Staphylococcus singaporensis]
MLNDQFNIYRSLSIRLAKAYVADTIVVFHNDVRGLFNRVCEVLGHVHFATKMMNNKKI